MRIARVFVKYDSSCSGRLSALDVQRLKLYLDDVLVALKS